MKIITRYKAEDDWGEGETFELEVPEVAHITVGDICPEDANLRRDLNWAFDIPKWLQAAYEAGKKGEPLEITEEPYED